MSISKSVTYWNDSGTPILTVDENGYGGAFSDEPTESAERMKELWEAMQAHYGTPEPEKYTKAAEAIVDHIDGDSNDYKAVMAILREWL